MYNRPTSWSVASPKSRITQTGAYQVNCVANPALQSVGALDISTKRCRLNVQITGILQRCRGTALQLLYYLEATDTASFGKEGKVVHVSQILYSLKARLRVGALGLDYHCLIVLLKVRPLRLAH
jgi:hypothetical protein